MGVTHLDEHQGLTKQFRIQAAAPTDPTPEQGDVYIDNSTGAEALGLYTGSAWVYISLQV